MVGMQFPAQHSTTIQHLTQLKQLLSRFHIISYHGFVLVQHIWMIS